MAHDKNVIPLAPYVLAREGGRAERAGNHVKVRVIEERLRQLVGHPFPEKLCDIWWEAAGHGEAQ